MVGDDTYDPNNQTERAAKIREQKYEEVVALLSEMEYWQFRFRLWIARRYNYIREEVSFLFGESPVFNRVVALFLTLGCRQVTAGPSCAQWQRS